MHIGISMDSPSYVIPSSCPLQRDSDVSSEPVTEVAECQALQTQMPTGNTNA